ncbi:MAG: MOSC domain-containing protein [Candidatus Omnitrophica bacterium]|nr:MOSC domain-containing protein [Candidatus Omnitrophota bacterium]MBU1923598.1 MOSC domain-containing protein [Candidatus Omnitrophota bacterium]
MGRVKALCMSKEKGTKKENIKVAIFKENFGIENDAHAGSPRQVSLLAEESIEKMRARGLSVGSGDFAENIVSEGIDLKSLSLATKIKIGRSVILEIVQIGKACVSRCAIYYKTGDCIMPREGVFAKVLKGGIVKVGAKMKVL